jgi:hypothetical protein
VRIRPLTLAAVGVALVAIDLRFTWSDALPDVLGWGLIALAAYRLDMRLAAGLTAAGAVCSLAELHLPYEWQAYELLSGRIIEDPGPGTAYDERLVFLDVDGPRLALMILAVALGGAGLTLMLRELHRRAATTGDERSAQRLAVLSWAVPLGWILPFVLVAVGWTIEEGSFDPVWGDQWELVAIVGIVIAISVALLFATTPNRRWSASGDELGSPWGEMMVRDVDAAP